MYYPAGFAYIYAFLRLITGGKEKIIIQIHIILSVILTYLSLRLFSPFMKTEHRLIFMALPILAQNYYRAGISRVTNDLILSFFILLLLHSVLKKKFYWSSFFFSLAVSFKMNALFFGPSLLFIYLQQLPFLEVFIHFFFMGLFQVILPLPFLLNAPLSYLKLAFNFGRDFEYRVNMAWGFLGDSIRHDKTFYGLLLFCTVFFLAIFFLLIYKLFFVNEE